jgi:hypothetical protein
MGCMLLLNRKTRVYPSLGTDPGGQQLPAHLGFYLVRRVRSVAKRSLDG